MINLMEILRMLEWERDKFRCPACSGLGKVYDAEPGDISFNSESCSDCKGSGFSKNGLIKFKELIASIS